MKNPYHYSASSHGGQRAVLVPRHNTSRGKINNSSWDELCSSSISLESTKPGPFSIYSPDICRFSSSTRWLWNVQKLAQTASSSLCSKTAGGVFFFNCFALLKAVLLTRKKGKRVVTFSSKLCTVNSICKVIQGTPCLKQWDVKICGCGIASCFPLHYLSSLEEHTWKQFRGYSRFIKWDKMKQERWIPERLTPCEKPVATRLFGAWG